MPAEEQQTRAREEIARILDELSLPLMVTGAGALTAELLSSLASHAQCLGSRDLQTAIGDVQAQLASDRLTDDGARSVVTRLQSTLAQSAPAQDTSTPSTASSTYFKEDPEILGDFVMEASEHLSAIDEKILLLEKDPTLVDTVHAVFRGFHTIKGLAGFLGLTGVQAVAHEVETLLDHARNARMTVTSEVVDLVLESSEYLKEEVACVQAQLNQQPAEAIRDNRQLILTLSRANANVTAGQPLPVPTAALAAQSSEFAMNEDPAPSKEEASEAQAPKSDGVQIDKAMPDASPIAVAAFPAQFATPAPSLAVVQDLATLGRSERLTGAIPAAPSTSIKEAPPAKAFRGDAATSSIRVEVSKLDKLMDMVGELVIAQSVLTNNPRLKSDARVAGELSQLVRITGEVQRSAMSMRMMPIGPLFQKNAKMVRDLSRRNGKQVALELSGEATELDKTIAEELSDPLLHMIRNALDHGIEEPAERIAAGKDPVASLHIGAEHQAGQVVISISDDGRGLDPERIRRKAVQNGLVDSNAQLSQDEIYKLIFAPGFSTAEKITDISGRGVGMDVVRQHVETLRGRIEIKSELGKGTTFYIFLPLTLAIIEGLVIIVGEHRYIVPVFSVREMFRPTADMLFTVQGRDEMILIRGELLPLVRLHQRLEIVPRTTDICEGLLVVCEFSGKRYCLFVDDLLGRQEIVIKSLDQAFKAIRGISGSAILGSGRIGLILDVAGIFHAPSSDKEAMAA